MTAKITNRSRRTTVEHWNTEHALTLIPQGDNLTAVFEDGKRLGWVEYRVKPGTVKTAQHRAALVTLDESPHMIGGVPVRVTHWVPTQARALETLLYEIKAPMVAAARRAELAAESTPENSARMRLRTARVVLAAAEDARTRAVTDRRNAVSAALAAGMNRADIAAELEISRQMVDRLADGAQP